MREKRAKEKASKMASYARVKAIKDTSKISAGTLLTLYSYMFHVFCFTSIKVIIFNTDLLSDEVNNTLLQATSSREKKAKGGGI